MYLGGSEHQILAQQIRKELDNPGIICIVNIFNFSVVWCVDILKKPLWAGERYALHGLANS